MFQRIVLTVAIIILIITLAIMGLLMFNNHSAVQWPPEVSSCPDYFTASAPNVCQNTEKIKVSNSNCILETLADPATEAKPATRENVNGQKNAMLHGTEFQMLRHPIVKLNLLFSLLFSLFSDNNKCRIFL
jgi:hypothetical protein